jgi:hypothetical protein
VESCFSDFLLLLVLGRDRNDSANTNAFGPSCLHKHLQSLIRNSFVGFEMRLAHAIKVALSLLGAINDLAHARLSAMTLAETLRLDDVSAARSATVTTLVLDFIVDP